MTEPEPEQPTVGEVDHFTPDIICPFCHQNVSNTRKAVLEKDLQNQQRTEKKILKD